MNKPIHILDLEIKLLEDESGAYRDQLCDALRTELADIKRYINQGLSPDEFQQASRVADAIEASILVVEKVWRLESGPGWH